MRETQFTCPFIFPCVLFPIIVVWHSPVTSSQSRFFLPPPPPSPVASSRSFMTPEFRELIFAFPCLLDTQRPTSGARALCDSAATAAAAAAATIAALSCESDTPTPAKVVLCLACGPLVSRRCEEEGGMDMSERGSVRVPYGSLESTNSRSPRLPLRLSFRLPPLSSPALAADPPWALCRARCRPRVRHVA